MADNVSDQESKGLKAGHPPAVKVAGGVRITQHKMPSMDKAEPKRSNSKDDGGDEEEEPIVEPPKPMITTISGAPVRGNEDFPASSVKAYHDKKPTPTNEFRSANKGLPSNHFIHQPKK